MVEVGFDFGGENKPGQEHAPGYNSGPCLVRIRYATEDNGSYGLSLWGSALVLAQWLGHLGPERLFRGAPGQSILELGSGTGLGGLGLACALLSPSPSSAGKKKVLVEQEVGRTLDERRGVRRPPGCSEEKGKDRAVGEAPTTKPEDAVCGLRSEEDCPASRSSRRGRSVFLLLTDRRNPALLANLRRNVRAFNDAQRRGGFPSGLLPRRQSPSCSSSSSSSSSSPSASSPLSSSSSSSSPSPSSCLEVVVRAAALDWHEECCLDSGASGGGSFLGKHGESAPFSEGPAMERPGDGGDNEAKAGGGHDLDPAEFPCSSTGAAFGAQKAATAEPMANSPGAVGLEEKAAGTARSSLPVVERPRPPSGEKPGRRGAPPPLMLFDAVVGADVLYDSAGASALAGVLRRRLRPGGRFFAVSPAWQSSWRALKEALPENWGLSHRPADPKLLERAALPEWDSNRITPAPWQAARLGRALKRDLKTGDAVSRRDLLTDGAPFRLITVLRPPAK